MQTKPTIEPTRSPTARGAARPTRAPRSRGQSALLANVLSVIRSAKRETSPPPTER